MILDLVNLSAFIPVSFDFPHLCQLGRVYWISSAKAHLGVILHIPIFFIWRLFPKANLILYKKENCEIMDTARALLLLSYDWYFQGSVCCEVPLMTSLFPLFPCTRGLWGVTLVA